MSFINPNINNPQSELNPISLSQLDKLIEISFNNVQEQVETQSAKDHKFVKLGGLTYQLIDEESDNLNFKDNLQHRHLSFKDEMKASSDSDSTFQKQSDNNSKHNDGDHNLYVAINHGLIIRLLPQNPAAFLNDLDSSLRNFIKDTVEIIKNLEKKEYQFKFGNLDLDVLIKQDDNKLTIKLTSEFSDFNIKLTEQDRLQLVNLLQQDFPDEEIEVVFLEDETMSNFDHDKDQNQQEKPPRESGSDNDEMDVVITND